MIVDEKSKPNFRLSTNFDVTEISYVYNGGGGPHTPVGSTIQAPPVFGGMGMARSRNSPGCGMGWK